MLLLFHVPQLTTMQVSDVMGMLRRNHFLVGIMVKNKPETIKYQSLCSGPVAASNSRGLSVAGSLVGLDALEHQRPSLLVTGDPKIRCLITDTSEMDETLY